MLYYPVSDSLLILNATGKMVWELLQEGYGEDEISAAIAQQFGISEEHALHDIGPVIAELATAGLQGEAKEGVTFSDTSHAGNVAPNGDSELGDCGTFRFGEKRIRIRCSASEVLGSFLSRFRHRAVGDGDGTEVLQISESNSGYRLTFREIVVDEVTTTAAMISRVVQFLMRMEHPNTSFLAFCHAAAVCRGNQALLMPGGSGTGKSTLTGFLLAHGFTYLCDDVIAIGEDEAALLPLPTCLSIKSGSWSVLEPIYHVLAELPTFNRYGRLLRYVEPQGNYEVMPAAGAPSAIVFPAYQAGVLTRVQSLGPLETMIRLTGAHAALSRPATQRKLEKFLRFVEQTPAYELTYSELPSALKAIEDLLAAQPQQ